MNTVRKQLITSSRKSSNDICRKRHWWEYEIGLRKTTSAKALRMGSAFHVALDGLKQNKSLEVVIQILQATYAIVPDNCDTYDWQIEYETLARLICAYQWRWQDSDIEIISTEQSFRLPLLNPATGRPSTNFDFAGVIDAIIRLEDGRKAVMEHKLLGEDHGPDSDLRKRLRLDSQISNYVHAARRLDPDIDSALYDVTRKPSIKPSPIPLVDEDGLKIVFNSEGNRVRNASRKPKKKCEDCGGSGETLLGRGNPNCFTCPCTLGPWRQTADTAKDYVLQTRPMTVKEWGEKLTADIVERPDWYFSRTEIPRLDDEIEESRVELWQVQKIIRESQLSGYWFRTVNRNTCSWCGYFDLCSAKFNPETEPVPEGFERITDPHPELSRSGVLRGSSGDDARRTP